MGADFDAQPLIEPKAPPLPSIALGFWSSVPQVRAALDVNALFFVGIPLAFAVYVFLIRTGWGLMLRTVGDSEDAARALGFPVLRVRIIATMAGGFLAGIGGSFLSLSYPGSWSEGLSSGMSDELAVPCTAATSIAPATPAMAPATTEAPMIQRFTARPIILATRALPPTTRRANPQRV
nr:MULTISPECIES: hypothetical protein [unclassified Bradyrhizobium]